MKQFFILGASGVYGVGAEHDGWSDLLKAHLHRKMYGQDGIGEKYEVFNFAKAGCTVEFVEETAEWLYGNYGRGDDVVTLISVGGNDARAMDTPDNFACTPEAFREKVTHLLKELQKYSSRVIFVANSFVDESKTNPKLSPFRDGKPSYFTNGRRTMFNNISKQICEAQGIDFVSIDIDQATWVRDYLYSDGLHPNQAGHQRIFEQLRPVIETCL